MLLHETHSVEPEVHNVLVADDDDELRALVVGTLRDDGYSVVEARDGAELLQLISDSLDDPSTRPDVIVTDVRMPRLSGLGVLDALKRARVRVPVVMMTGFAPESVDVVARRLGALGVLKKPFDVDDLRTAVMNATRCLARGPFRPSVPGSPMTKFCRFELGTTEPAAARAFYAKILGHDRAIIRPLHAQALARGARPHWLGHIGVADVEGMAGSFVERGATRLGPSRSTPDGGSAIALRDPGGAVIALATLPTTAAHSGVDVVWHVLHTNDAPRATEHYTELFGWELTRRTDLGSYGTFQEFAWQMGGRSVGAIADVAGRSGVHPHWLYFFEVDSLESTIADARAAGGVVLPPFVLPTGERACVLDDPQGAAFALRERALA